MLSLIRCYVATGFQNLLLQDTLGFRVQKSIENGRKRVLDSVNLVLFSKRVSNKFITVQDGIDRKSVCSNSILAFIALRWTRFRVQKSIENARKRVLDAVNLDLFIKTVSNKFITMQDIVFIILLYCNSIPEFVA